MTSEIAKAMILGLFLGLIIVVVAAYNNAPAVTQVVVPPLSSTAERIVVNLPIKNDAFQDSDYNWNGGN